MDLSDFVDSIETEDFQKRRKLAKEKSYEVLQNIDINEYGKKLGEVRQNNKFVGDSPSVFVSRSNYPNVQSGILSPLTNKNPTELVTNPNWYESDLSIKDILKRRTSLMNSQKESDIDVYDVWDGYVGVQREIALSDNPVGVDINIERTNGVKPQLDNISSPMGPSASAMNANLTENPHIPKPVKKVEEDDEWKSTEALYYLYKKGFDVYQLQDVFSTGTLGKKENRKLVPTRWAITAIDDTIGRKLRSDIKKNRLVNKTSVYYNSYIGNQYWIIETPGQWEFELVEIKESDSVWNPTKSGIGLSSAYENYMGRNKYVEETAGAYYASRLAALENLDSKSRQSKFLIIRVVTDDYWAPTGVWQIRESLRNAFNNDRREFEKFSDAITSVVEQTPASLERLKRKSEMLSGVQRSLEWFDN
jgi:hypothetical protein